MIDRTIFFSAIRSSSLFNGKLNGDQVKGIEAILDACDLADVTDLRMVSNILAQCYHETGAQMMPVKETVFATSFNRNPSDATVIARLDVAFRNGDLPWVKTPYWRDGWFGRGLIQPTHKANYERVGRALGVDLVANRDLALDLKISARIAVIGMRDGLFTGRKLGDFFNATANNPPAARSIVNGDGTTVGPKIAEYHGKFLAALKAATPKDLTTEWLESAPAPVEKIRVWLARKPDGATL